VRRQPAAANDTVIRMIRFSPATAELVNSSGRTDGGEP
jgi:hypothetical protein